MNFKASPDSLSAGDLLALVTYLPDPLASFLTELRDMLPGQPHPESHITFLPPRPLAVSAVDASAEIQRLLHLVRPFDLELGKVCLFPETNILYLDIKSGLQDMLSLHDCLNRGLLFAEEAFEYIPHLTLGGPVQPHQVADCMRQTSDAWENSTLSRKFSVAEVVLLRQFESGGLNEWSRISSHSLTCGAANASQAVIQTSVTAVPE